MHPRDVVGEQTGGVELVVSMQVRRWGEGSKGSEGVVGDDAGVCVW